LVSAADILNGRILVVDDVDANVRLLELILRSAGYVCVASTMDRQGVRLHRKNRYTVLLDLRCRAWTDSGDEPQGNRTGRLSSVLVMPRSRTRSCARCGPQDFIGKPLSRRGAGTRSQHAGSCRCIETKNLYARLWRAQPRSN
jgi:adenylate cyclase